MPKKSKKRENKSKQLIYEIGAKVKILIPRVDRKNHQKFLPCIILDVNEESGMITLGSAAGTLDRVYNSNEIKPLGADDWPEMNHIPRQTISLQMAAGFHSQSPNWKDLSLSSPCHCQSKCIKIQCSCYAAFLKCTSECHHKRKCSNYISKIV